MKRIISLLLCISLVFTMIPAVLAADDGSLSNFQKTRTYEDGQFTDVLSIHWFADSVKAAYEYGLVNGDSITAYNPDGNVTIAETLTLACRLNDIYYGGTGSFTQGAPWYQVYVDYAIAHGMITEGQYADYDAPATRAQFVTILAKALPQEALPAINSVAPDTIPDVSASADYASDVYAFYNAGILMGNDTYGTFGPSSNILRSEVATIVVRLADKSQRKSFVLTPTVPVTSVELAGSAWVLYVGTPVTYTATVLPKDATNKSVTWTSSDTSVATVSASGVVTPIKDGAVTITVSSANGKTASRSVYVKTKVDVESITLMGDAWSLNADTYVKLTAIISPTNATDQTVIWKSSDTSVARVSSAGIVTGIKAGTAVITATASNGKTASRQMTVQAATPAQATTDVGKWTFNYLAYLARSNGTLSSDGTYYDYVYYTDSDDSATYTYSIRYILNKNDIGIYRTSVYSNHTIFAGVEINQSLSKPYEAVLTNKTSETTIRAGANLTPESYDWVHSDMTFSYYTGSTDTGSAYRLGKLADAVNINNGIYYALTKAEEQLLKPAGYSITALGFYSL